MLLVLHCANHDIVDEGAYTSEQVSAFELSGHWQDEYGTAHDISQSFWTMTYEGDSVTFDIVVKNIENKYVILRKPFVEKFSKIWYGYSTDSSIFYCAIAVDKNTIAEAESEEVSDDVESSEICKGNVFSKLNQKIIDKITSMVEDKLCFKLGHDRHGRRKHHSKKFRICLGPPWVQLFKRDIEIEGSWQDDQDNNYRISNKALITQNATANATAAIVQYNNFKNILITENSNQTFSKIAWVKISNNESYICTIVKDQASLFVVQEDTTAYNIDNLQQGCHNAGWTKLSPNNNTIVDIELLGDWNDNYGGVHSIENEAWTSNYFGSESISSIKLIMNDVNTAIIQLPADDFFNPNKFSKIVWAEIDNDASYYCTVNFGHDTLEQALNAPALADASNAANNGCGGFAWTQLNRQTAVVDIELLGSWTDNWGGIYTITNDIWTTDYFGSASTSSIVQVLNESNTVIVQSPPDDLYTPNKFNKIVWTDVVNDSSYYCIVVFGMNTAQEALDDTTVADPSNPDNGGCSGFSWTKLTKSP